MSRSINKVTLLGRVGKDPELKYTPNGTAYARFSLATSYKAKDKGEKTEWHSLVAWAKTAEIAGEYVKKGQQVYVEGRLQTDSWEKDGEKKYRTEIVVMELVLLGSKGEAKQETGDEQPAF